MAALVAVLINPKDVTRLDCGTAVPLLGRAERSSPEAFVFAALGTGLVAKREAASQRQSLVYMIGRLRALRPRYHVLQPVPFRQRTAPARWQ
jgi:hypothetical protein